MRSHNQSVVIELNRRRITGSISYKPLISDLSVLRVCNKTGGTIKGGKKNIATMTNGNDRNNEEIKIKLANTG